MQRGYEFSQRGAALLTALVLVSICTMLAASAMQQVTSELRLTSLMSLHAQARHAALAGLETALSSPLRAGESQIRTGSGEQSPFTTRVAVVLLGETRSYDSETDTTTRLLHYRLTATASGPRNVVAHRTAYRSDSLAF